MTFKRTGVVVLVALVGLVVMDMVSATRSQFADYDDPAPDEYYYETGSDTADYVTGVPEITSQVAVVSTSYQDLALSSEDNTELSMDEVEDMVYTVLDLDADENGTPNLVKLIADKRSENGGDSCWVALKLNLVYMPGLKHTLSDQTDPRVARAVLNYLVEKTDATRITLLACGGYSGLMQNEIFNLSEFPTTLGHWNDFFNDLPDDFSWAGMVEEAQALAPEKTLDMVNLNYDELYNNGKSYYEMTSEERRATSLARVSIPEGNGIGALATSNGGALTPTKSIYMSDVLVNVPKLKTTASVVVNAVMKNYIGSVSRGVYGNNKNRTSSLSQLDHGNLYQTVTNLFSMHPTDYAIVDALNGMEGEGSHPYGVFTGYLKLNYLLAGADPIAVESVCSQAIGVNPGDVPMLRYARAKGYGYYEPSKIRIVGDRIEDIECDFRLAVGSDSNENAYNYGRGCVRWLVAGPFDGDDLSALPGGIDPASLSPIRGDITGGKVWSNLISAGSKIDLAQSFSDLDGKSVLAFTRIYSETAQEGLLWVGATEGVRVWVNGELLIDGTSNVGYKNNKLEAALSLNEGDNEILVQLENTSGDMGFSLACVKDGTKTKRTDYVPYTWTNGGWTGLGEVTQFSETDKQRFFGGGTLMGTIYHLAAGPVEYQGQPHCDVDGNGKMNVTDAIAMLLGQRDDPSNPIYDYNMDGNPNISDVIALLVAIRDGSCPDAQSAVLAAETETLELNAEDIAYLEKIIAGMTVSEEQREELLMAIYGDNGQASLPKAFSLAQNSPNPFNPSTTINYSVADGGSVHVSLKVYDVRGKLVSVLVNDVKDAGTYSVYWNGSDSRGNQVASGVYFYRLQAGTFEQTRKMVLLK